MIARVRAWLIEVVLNRWLARWRLRADVVPVPPPPQKPRAVTKHKPADFAPKSRSASR